MKRAIGFAVALLVACSGDPAPVTPPPAPAEYHLAGNRLVCTGASSEWHDPFPVTYSNPYNGTTVVIDIATEGCYFACANGSVMTVEANLNRSPPAISVFSPCG